MKPRKIEKHYKLRPDIAERIKSLQEAYELTETETVERALEFGLNSLRKFLRKNKETAQGKDGSEDHNKSLAQVIGERQLEEMQRIAKAKWIDDEE